VPELHELSERECEELLRSGVTGRVALCTPTGPQVLPVNYAVLDDAVVIRTSPYSRLGTYGRDTMLAFEIDGLDAEHERGWSVQARGRAEVVERREELDRIRDAGGPQPWAVGQRALHLRIRWTELSGRQLGGDWDPHVYRTLGA
jgi:nitroimidazol reductase NimA-like FMN-containing flavoprotein (pyridoxamine 5'-phosphate oxidase superfamily)